MHEIDKRCRNLTWSLILAKAFWQTHTLIKLNFTHFVPVRFNCKIEANRYTLLTVILKRAEYSNIELSFKVPRKTSNSPMFPRGYKLIDIQHLIESDSIRKPGFACIMQIASGLLSIKCLIEIGPQCGANLVVWWWNMHPWKFIL